MERTVIKVGNSLAVALPPEMLRAYRLQQGSKVRIELDEEHGGILVKPAEAEVAGIDAEFARQLDDFINQYRQALDSLAQR